MSECSWCGTDEIFLYQCDHCGSWFCPEHDKPEDHDCPGLLLETEETNDVNVDKETTVETSDRINFAYPLDIFKNRLLIPVKGRLSPISLTLITVLVLLFIIVGGITYYTGYFGTTSSLGASESDPIASHSSPSGQTTDTAELNQTVVERSVFERINQRRANNGIRKLNYDSRLGKIARYHSQDMGTNDYTGHESPAGETVRDRYAKFNYSCQTVGELVLKVQPQSDSLQYDTENELAEGVVQSWMESEAHRPTLLNDSWNKSGIGIFITDKTEIYVTLNLC